IYAYTLYQQKQAQVKLETVFQEKTAQIREEYQQNNSPLTGIGGYIDEYSIFSNSGALKMQQLNQLKATIEQKQIAEQISQQKAQELQKQAKILQRSSEIENNLKEIQANLGEKLALADKFLKKDEEKALNQSFLIKLERISVISSEESSLLSQLRLSLEQFIAISCQAYRFNEEEKEYLSDNYVNLTNEQQLTLLNS
ncbi:7561_t:CDS:2, partial [Ambispora leptoticha]